MLGQIADLLSGDLGNRNEKRDAAIQIGILRKRISVLPNASSRLRQRLVRYRACSVDFVPV
jgi:hypothetical protein